MFKKTDNNFPHVSRNKLKIRKIEVKPKEYNDSNPPEIVDQMELIEDFSKNPNASFKYMIYSVERSSKYFTPYALKIVSYKDVGRTYMTISSSGVTQYAQNSVTFTPLCRWKREYIFYLKLMKIKFFSNYPLWKALYYLKKYIKIKKFNKAKNYIGKNLFICDNIIGNSILKINHMFCNFFDESFFDSSIIQNMTLFEFVELQFIKLENVKKKLDNLRIIIVEIIYKACLESLFEAGYTIDDSNITFSQTIYGKLGEFSNKISLPNNNSNSTLKMSFIEQANKREKCHRLSNFIHLIDYVTVNMMHDLLEKTYIQFFKVLKIHTDFLSVDEEMDCTLVNTEIENSRPTDSPYKEPYFLVDMIISADGVITIDPLENVFNFVMSTIQTIWTETIIKIKPLLTDSHFQCFTKPIINHKILKNKLSGEPPNVNDIIKQSTIIENLINKINIIFKKNFIIIHKYLSNYLNIEKFYMDNIMFDDNIIRQNKNCNLIKELCEKYKNEIDCINNVVDVKSIGIFNLKTDRFKTKALSATLNKKKILVTVVPGTGKSKADELLKKTQEAKSYLESDPTTADEYFEFLKYVDKAQQYADTLEHQLDYVKEIYDVIDEYGIPVSDEDIDRYLSISAQLSSLRRAVDRRLEDRETLVEKFNINIEIEIKKLTEIVSRINDKIVEPWLLDIESDTYECLETLDEYTDTLKICTNKLEEFQSHQKRLKLEISRLEILSHVTNEVKLRKLLWDSKISWADFIVDWYTADFNTLNVDEITNITNKYLKNIIQLEKGLPINNVLPKLKEDVEIIRDKLPVISYLRNSNLKTRHWIKIEKLLNYNYQPDIVKLTLQFFDDIDAFLYYDELLEISGSATSEANLESMLNKVQDIWKNLEFIIIPHKNSKDVFILGSLEEIQGALDESNINIQTIGASRHVAPIKPRLDEWSKQLDLFSQTLEAWQYCQQQWMYLEAIFSAPDIQRQLSDEANLFTTVDKSWKDIMRKTAKMPLAMVAGTQSGLLEQLEKNNKNLDEITKCLEAYLETKRIAFPRFFFLSNDELLEILAQTKNPHAVQKHLQKCFDAIYRLEFATKSNNSIGKEPILTTDILAMLSPEGERVILVGDIKAKGNVENWLGKVEESMFISLKKKMKLAILDLKKRVSQIFWSKNVHIIFESKNIENSMRSFEQKCYSDLNELAAMVRQELPALERDVIINLITIDVHARDIITSLVNSKVSSSQSFEWTKNLRYYWDDNMNNCLARMSNAEYLYGYEYLGAQKRLVITPLTDKCYLCLMGALQLDLGGAPAGPAGTGKTETTKDLAKALAIQCVVFNCSEGLDFKMMGRFFSGLATSGAWCCFDEFNRIDIEVLSVIAQQLITIKNAKISKLKKFLFEGRFIKLVMSCATFITMNPGYAGRTELPDNLKSLFRPISMMVPDYKLIAEVTLYSEGFETSKKLSIKMTLMYTLCSEQLSQQDHYDFGMRAVKSVLVMAGSLKRNNPDKSEDVVLICALRNSNLPKFLADDAELFVGILADLFPNTVLPDDDYGIFQDTIIKVMEDKLLQPEKSSIKKIIQLHETMQVRHGVMLVGPTGAGKTTLLHTLSETYIKLNEMEEPGVYNKNVNMYTLNPKAVTMGELYGEIDLMSNEWRDGLLGSIIRTVCSVNNDDHQWVICDGPVDALWIENMNTVLDDNKMLCLANSERIKFTPYVKMIFEVMDLAQASPATVSRCGMVYVDPSELGWMPYVKTWINKIANILPNKEAKLLIHQLFDNYIQDGLLFFKKYCDHAIGQVDISKVNMVCSLLESIFKEKGAFDKTLDKTRMRTFIVQAFIFSYIWGIGGNIIDTSREAFELFINNQFADNTDARLPASGDLWNFYINVINQRMDLWLKLMPPFIYDGDKPFFEILVPTIDTVRYGYIISKMIDAKKPVFVTGETGVGKTVIVKVVLNSLRETGTWIPANFNFSAQTSSKRTQEILELKLEKKKRTLLGAPIGKKICIFVDDVNMPRYDTYGSQPPIELLRQVLDFQGFYDREKLYWKDIENIVLVAACAPPGGGRNPLSPRFTRHFGMLVVPMATESSLKSIFRSILQGFLSFNEFSQGVINICDKIVNATVEIYDKISDDLLPTPEKSHYVFNLRDLSKCIQGIMQVEPSTTLFHDRLIDTNDKNYFYRLLSSTCYRIFGDEVIRLPAQTDETIDEPPILYFGDFMNFGASKESRYYEEITNVVRMKEILQDYLDDFCLVANKDIKLIFFTDAIQHLCRLARILRSERGHGLLVGVGGMGKQSLTRLASHLNGYPCSQIEVCRGYDINSWHIDLREFYLNPGAYAKDATFLFTDTQIVVEEFLEDINNTLNSGEVPNLFEADELEKAIIATRPAAKDAGISEENRDEIFDFFISRVRNHLHLVLCMSPVGDAFRRRCRMFPSLVNCCTIDWFTKWPNDALLSVAETCIAPLIIDNTNKVKSLASICVLMHQSVEDMTHRYFTEMKRRYYTTPSSYLELLKLYSSTLERKNKELTTMRAKIENGLNKLNETNETVVIMKKDIIELAPQLKISSEQVTKLMKVVQKQKVECDKVRTVVLADEAHAKIKANETALLEAEARKDLESAIPALQEAEKALKSLNKNDINEIKVFQNPPNLVRVVMEAVCLLLGEKTDWPSAKSVLSDGHFLERLVTYPKDNISNKLLKDLEKYVDNPDFLPHIVAKQSKVCKSMCIWVRAISGYAKLYRIVEPKREKLKEAQIELHNIEDILREKQKELFEVEEKIIKLEEQYNLAVNNLAELQANISLSEKRLKRSGKLIVALADEEIRWKKSILNFKILINNLIGDVLLAAGALAYLGAFTQSYRQELLNNWLDKCRIENIDITSNFSLIGVLGDSYKIKSWNFFGLPRDDVSAENALFVTQARRWPLMIDPQEQAYRWIRNMEMENSIKICEMTNPNLMRIMENCIRLGMPIMLNNVGEVLDPSLEPILLQQVFVQAGKTLIRLGNSDIEYESGFKLYMTTKLGNPHYLPEICIKVTIVNFTVTPSDLEIMRDELVANINYDKTQLLIIEDKILSMLFNSGDNILDNEELIESLNDSKETSKIIGTRVIDSEKTEQDIIKARDKYRSVATRGSVLFFVVSSLNEIDPMYQFSLKYFNQLFNNVIETSKKSENINERLQILYDKITLSIYLNVSRGLFEKHKLILSFMFNVAILLNENKITYPQWNFILRGPGPIQVKSKPDYPTLSETTWKSINYLNENFPKFNGLLEDGLKQINIKLDYLEEIINVIPENNIKSTKNWNENLDDIEKLMLIKCLKEDKLIFGINAYIKKNLGQQFVESSIVSLPDIYPDTSNVTPLIFILSTGSDPFASFVKFAIEKEYKDKYSSISLGQGQGPIAEELIKEACKTGRWIYLQNCHLAKSWMPSLERIVIEIIEDNKSIDKNFRLFLSSMPSPSFPVAILENSVKVTNEPPKGLKANIKRELHDLPSSIYDDNDKININLQKMIFGVCFFHAIIQERKKFGPLGWNINYEFSDNDRECCLLNLKLFCNTNDNIIPWNALIYTTGEITYGGRITDNWDLRCLKTILDNYLSPKTLDDNYCYSSSGIYYCPGYDNINKYKEYVDKFPLIEEPEIFGMHENANITYQLNETKNILNTIIDIQPKINKDNDDKSSSDIVYELAQIIMDKIDISIDHDKCNKEHYKKDTTDRLPSLTIVLIHEVDRYNKLLDKIHVSMDNLQRAIKGFVVMSDELEYVFNALMNNQVPKLWHNVNVYPSLKTLGSWIRDLELRIDFIKMWLIDKLPISFWFSGFSFPQGFITGVLQTYARKYNIPIDHLKLDYTVLKKVLRQEDIGTAHFSTNKEDPKLYKGLSSPEDGVFVHGLFLDAARWDFNAAVLVDAAMGEMNPSLPVVHILPVVVLPENDKRYVCPLYKTAIRAGVLSTTGHSTNFVVPILLPSSREQSYWILKGTALLIQVTD
ncbi:hypothetical protein HCN44_003514 [Aphidius gifuensis]|uniref:AAA+ ATPase domain-containing protein n=1 Tax=Aphidius gifuensis TaxID=684658 RepID=A0A834XKG2_APHGI|nr:hypothetical protein HCN44_003514 [Aphidius gifuensis]